METILLVIAGIIVGFIFGKVLVKKPISSGQLRIDNSDPDSPYLFIEFNSSDEFNKLYSVKQVYLDVKKEDFLPRK